jgi:hypothetical protein
MRVTIQDPSEIYQEYIEYIDSNHKSLTELKDMKEDEGYQVRLNPWDKIKWVLTVWKEK